ncbi:FtsX-like permease family protein [Oleidesulfovibrio sp.]|uniref:FtsX-like permease family protein n=1 Tax=Oleidesulfovibrio sp. TaxID=2909707 RepID=UPI003A835785
MKYGLDIQLSRCRQPEALQGTLRDCPSAAITEKLRGNFQASPPDRLLKAPLKKTSGTAGYGYHQADAVLHQLCLFLAAAVLCLGLIFNALPAAATETLTLEETIRAMAFLRDRAPGTVGGSHAASLMERGFSSAFPTPEGLSGNVVIGRQPFMLPARVHDVSSITILPDGSPAAIAPLLMNRLSTGSTGKEGVTGMAVWSGSGSLADFDGMDVKGSVVLMDMNSGKHWINAARLGASALIMVDFTKPGEASRRLFQEKLEPTPIDFPVFWMPQAQAEKYFGPLDSSRPAILNKEVRLHSLTVWQRVEADNVFCFIPGSDPALDDGFLLVEAFYDVTGMVPGATPAADQAASAAALVEAARQFALSPPKRSVLLVATAGHSQGKAGSRELAWALSAPRELMLKRQQDARKRSEQAETILGILQEDMPLAVARSPQAFRNGSHDLVRDAFRDVLKNKEDDITRTLMRLRLEASGPERNQKIQTLAKQRITLRRLPWTAGTLRESDAIDEQSRTVLMDMLPEVAANQQRMLMDAQADEQSMTGALIVRDLVGKRRMDAGISLHLSSHGDGLGGFQFGWLYELNDTVNRTRQLGAIDAMMQQASDRQLAYVPGNADATRAYRVWRKKADELRSLGIDPGPYSPPVPLLLSDTLRPSRARPWQSYLPDRPQLGAEPLALAGFPALTLATLHDTRTTWTTPNDLPEAVNFDFLRRQSKLINTLLHELATSPAPDIGKMPRSGFSTLDGRANMLRQGELFPDRNAENAVFIVFQGKTVFPAISDATGRFYVPGLARYNQTVHKAVIEGYRFAPQTGLAVWAIDKELTGKNAYRVKMKREQVRTDLTMFGCTQSTLFGMVNQRTFRHLTVPQLIDARTEAAPLRYWYSRLDTRSSTLNTLFLEPDVPYKMTFSDNFIDRKMLLLNASDKNPQGAGYLMADWPVLYDTEYKAARDMWALLGPRIDNLEDHGIINERIRDLRQRGEALLADADDLRSRKKWDSYTEAARASLSLASLAYNDVDTTQRDVLAGVLFYIALFVPFAYCLERLLFGFASINKRIAAFSIILLTIIGIIYAVHPAFRLTYSPAIVILAFFILGLSAIVSLIIFMRFEREMEDLQRRSRHLRGPVVTKGAAMAAAAAIGVSNLRRRPMRTALTCATLVILTFTIMNFTAARSIRQAGWVSFSDTAPYQGLLLKDLGWRTLPPEALQAANALFASRNASMPRMQSMSGSMRQAEMQSEIPPAGSSMMQGANAPTGTSAYSPTDEKSLVEQLASRTDASASEQLFPVGSPDMTTPRMGRAGMHGVVAPRVWYETSDQTRAPVIPLLRGTIESRLRGVVGLSPDEPLVSGLDKALVQGRWFHSGEEHAIIIPQQVARSLDIRITPDNPLPQVTLWGMKLTVTGILRDNALRDTPDLDGEPMTPITYPNEAATQISALEAEALTEGDDLLRYDTRYEHVDGDLVAIMPARTLASAGGTLKALAVRLPQKVAQNEIQQHLLTQQGLGDRFGLMLFRGTQEGTFLYYAANATTYSGVSVILIPLAISALIVLNTMIGSVHERKNEIGIYTSVGLAPSHVAFLFVAEAMALAVISVVLGYLLAQGCAAVLAGTPVWQGMTANYSSTAGVAAMVMVMSVVLISTLYPARMASQVAIPDVTRAWKLPEVQGDTLSLPLPFLIKGREQACAGGYLMDYYEAHADISHGEFSTDSMDYNFISSDILPSQGITIADAELLDAEACFSMAFKVWLAPFDFGVRQNVRLVFCPSELYKGYRQIQVIIRREAGERIIWNNLNKRFLNDLRKQLLVWRSLDDSARQAYEAGLEAVLSNMGRHVPAEAAEEREAASQTGPDHTTGGTA